MGIGKDMILRILAAFLNTGVRQFVVLPILAATFSSEKYGTILTINSVASIIEVCLGNTLNNVRLIMKSKYEEQGKEGDFNILLAISLIVSTVATIVVIAVFKDFSYIDCLLIWIVVVLGTLNSYFLVYYVMELRFNQMLIQSAIVAAGTIVGALLTHATNIWPFAFLIGNAFGMLYVLKTNPLIHEPFQWTPLRNEAIRRWIILIATALLSNALIYLDRLLLYPVLGGDAVANYTTACFFGKCVSALMPSIANVLLGYYVQKNFVMTRKKYLLINTASVGMCAIAFLFSIPFAPFLNRLIYPSLFESSLPYVHLANFATIIGAAAILAQSMVLRYCKTSLLLIIQAIYGVIYLGGGLLVLSSEGLIGFCYVVIVANLVKVIIMIATGYVKVGKMNLPKEEAFA